MHDLSARRTRRWSAYSSTGTGIAAHATSNAAIAGVFQLDMIGYNRVPPRSWEVHVGSPGSRHVGQRSAVLGDLLRRVTKLVAPGLEEPQVYSTASAAGDPAADRSDHASFHAHGYPACCVSEELFVGPLPGVPAEGNPSYHRRDDTAIDPVFAADIARVVAAAAWAMANPSDPAPAGARDARREAP